MVCPIPFPLNKWANCFAHSRPMGHCITTAASYSLKRELLTYRHTAQRNAYTAIRPHAYDARYSLGPQDRDTTSGRTRARPD